MSVVVHQSLLGALESLFPQTVGVSCLPITGLFPEGPPEEEACIERANGLRQQEFRAGRSCARKSMRKLGLPELPILANERRGPIWPSGVVGSISHTRAYCVAAVALDQEFRSLGLDIEEHNRLKSNLWRFVLTSTETQWIESLQPEDRIQMAGLIFSAKEAFYKYQYPLTGVWLGFQDVELSVFLDSMTFTVTLLRGLSPELERGASFSGRFAFFADYVVAGIC